MDQLPRKCTARRTNGEPCKNPPMRGGLVCRKHGGSAPQVRTQAKLRLAEQAAAKELARLDVVPIADPFEQLQILAGQAVAWKDQLAEKVNELTAIRYSAVGAGTEQLRAEVALFERALDRCMTVLTAMVKLNIEERLSRISEKQAEAVIRAVDVAIAAAGITGPAAVDARKAAARELRGAA